MMYTSVLVVFGAAVIVSTLYLCGVPDLRQPGESGSLFFSRMLTLFGAAGDGASGHRGL
jgi:hypothetical protein